MTELYIDVSHYDWDRFKGNLNWSLIKANGIDVVFIRASYGDPLIYNPPTRYFVEMALAAKDAGLKVGGYHNLIHGDFASIQRQVELFRDQLDSVGADYAMLDVEPYEALKTNDLWPRIADAELFAQEFRNQDKRRNLTIYLAQWVWSGWLDKADLRPLMSAAGGPLVNSNYPLGSTAAPYAELYDRINGDNGKGWISYGNVVPEIWQYSSNASVPGASPVTDVNAFKGSFADLDSRLQRRDVQMSAIEDILWPGMKALEPKSQLGGILARKRGYHNSRDHLPMPGSSTDYSVNEFAVDREGPANEGSAIDWTFPDAQNGNYATISKYSKRLYAARNDDPRTVYIREFFGQIDSDTTVEGWDYSKNKASSSDSSHLWHIHISVHRKYINSTAAMRAILSILKGQSVEDWKAENARNVVFEIFNASLPILKKGDSDDGPLVKGINIGFVARAQRQLLVEPDGEYGAKTAAAIHALLPAKDGNTIDLDVWRRLFSMNGATATTTYNRQGSKRIVTFQNFTGAKLPILKKGDSDEAGGVDGTGTWYVHRVQRAWGIADDGDYGSGTAAVLKGIGVPGRDGNTVDYLVYKSLYALLDISVTKSVTVDPGAKK